MSYVTHDHNPVVERPAVRSFTIPVPFLKGPAGDVLASITQAVGVRPCSPCEERRRWLNERLAFQSWGSE